MCFSFLRRFFLFTEEKKAAVNKFLLHFPHPIADLADPGPVGHDQDGAVLSVLDTAQAKRGARQRNTLLNYREQPSHFSLESIAFDPDEL